MACTWANISTRNTAHNRFDCGYRPGLTSYRAGTGEWTGDYQISGIEQRGHLLYVDSGVGVRHEATIAQMVYIPVSFTSVQYFAPVDDTPVCGAGPHR